MVGKVFEGARAKMKFGQKIAPRRLIRFVLFIGNDDDGETLVQQAEKMGKFRGGAPHIARPAKNVKSLCSVHARARGALEMQVLISSLLECKSRRQSIDNPWIAVSHQ
jgi:hypothetical protein